MAIELLGNIKGGINEFEKLLEILLLRDQRILELLESERSAHLRLMKARLTLLIIRLVRFLADMKFLWEVRVGFCFQARYALSLSSIASEQERSNHLAEAVDLVLRGMKLSIPAMTTLDTESATTEASWLEKQDAFQGKSRKKDRRSVHRALSNCQTCRFEGGIGGGGAQLHFTDIRL